MISQQMSIEQSGINKNTQFYFFSIFPFLLTSLFPNYSIHRITDNKPFLISGGQVLCFDFDKIAIAEIKITSYCVYMIQVIFSRPKTDSLKHST
jgi:hypothetical protein